MQPSQSPHNTRQDNLSNNEERPHGTILDEDTLMMFEEGLRTQLPGIDEIVARAATRKRRKKVATSVVAVLAVSGLLWLNPAYYSKNIVTAVGERRALTLHDGTEIALNTDSSLRIEYQLRSRHLYLEQGEALFTVTHPRVRSFVVHAKHTRVVDIGTVFNVRNTQDGAEVTVLDGSVEVTPEMDKTQKQLLHAGQKIDVGAAGMESPRIIDTELAVGWRHGKLYFNRTTLSDIIAELRRYRTQSIDLAPSLTELRISGQFDIDNIEQFFDLLPTLAPVTVHRRANGSVLIVSRTDASDLSPSRQ